MAEETQGAVARRLGIVPRNISDEMRESYLDYAMSVITARALPDVRDGLKPVHRRILYTMQQMGLHAGAKFRKSAAVIGAVMGQYHPHGDASIYDALVKMAQDFSMRYPLVMGQGNFGCFTGDTKLALADGRELSFFDLVAEDAAGKKNYTYTYNEQSGRGRIEIVPLEYPRITRENVELVRVTLDNVESVRCTPDHRFMLRDGSYREAQALKPGDSLMPLYMDFVFSSAVRAGIPSPIVLQPDSHTYNHSVVLVEWLSEREDVFDVTVDGTHNFALAAGVFVHNSIDGDPAAAMRYSEAKMSRLSAELLRDLEKETTDWRPNYDATRREPVVLPAAVPNLLLNGTLGIAVGMATNIPPHNLGEVAAALTHLIDNPDATSEDMLEYIKGPDFPTGAVLYGVRDLHHAYATGRGGVVVRGEAEITEGKDGTTQIIITSIPYRTNKADLMESIAALVRDKKLEGIKELRDESAKDIRVVVGLKNTAQPKQVLNFIYKHTGLEDTFHFNMVALDEGVPRTFSLKGMLEKFIEHRIDVVERRSRFDLARSEEREHILLGLKKALDQIDKIIKTIRASLDVATAHAALVREFRFSDKQATAILEMRLQKLAGLERKKVEEELLVVQKLIADLRSLLASPKRIRGVIKTELSEVAGKYGDERRTRIVRHGVKEMTDEDLIPDEESVLVLTQGGYVKRTNPSEYRRQRRGGVGVIDINTKEEDFVTTLLTASTLSDILFFTNRGKVYQTKMYDVPEGRRATRGKSIMNFLPLGQGEEVSSVLAMPSERRVEEALSVMLVTRQGRVKRVAAKNFHEVRKSGLIAITIPTDDQLVSTFFVGRGDDAIIATAAGQAIRFKSASVREMGRVASGVRGMRLGKNDSVVGADALRAGGAAPTLLVVSEKGYGKRTALKEYKTQGRGGGGIKTLKVSAKTGPLIRAGVVEDGEAEVVAISKRGQVIRLALREIPLLGRATQGVRIMKLREGDAIASTVCL